MSACYYKYLVYTKYFVRQSFAHISFITHFISFSNFISWYCIKFPRNFPKDYDYFPCFQQVYFCFELKSVLCCAQFMILFFFSMKLIFYKLPISRLMKPVEIIINFSFYFLKHKFTSFLDRDFCSISNL